MAATVRAPPPLICSAISTLHTNIRTQTVQIGVEYNRVKLAGRPGVHEDNAEIVLSAALVRAHPSRVCGGG